MKRNILLIIVALVALLAARIIYNKYRVVLPAVDINQSEIGWSGKSISDTHVGKLKLSKAELQFKNDELIGGMFEADMNSITVTDITDTADNRHFVDHIANEDFFEVNKYPIATFTATSVKPLGDNKYEVAGQMKIKDKINPITFEATVSKAEKGKRVSAVVNIDRTLYGIEYGAKDKPGSDKDWFILNDFTLNVNIVTGD
jgi:polyisoprenoid-binding protein YceI